MSEDVKYAPTFREVMEKRYPDGEVLTVFPIMQHIEEMLGDSVAMVRVGDDTFTVHEEDGELIEDHDGGFLRERIEAYTAVAAVTMTARALLKDGTSCPTSGTP